MLVTDVEDQMCWWQVWDVGDRFRMLVTDLIHWENRQHNEKSRQHNDSVTNIMILSPTSEISHHHKVTNITMSPLSLSLYLYCRVNDNLDVEITGINAWDVFNLIIRLPGRLVVALKWRSISSFPFSCINNDGLLQLIKPQNSPPWLETLHW